MIDTPAPPVTVVGGGPGGALDDGSAADLPASATDGLIAPGLKDWLTFEERRSLAVASAQAAAGPNGAPVAWKSRNAAGEITAGGTVLAASGAYRSLRGRICRDVRQSANKGAEPHTQTVTLCRAQAGSGVTLWVVSQAD
jgi:hypothetical protein